jgi:hypothetical protein
MRRHSSLAEHRRHEKTTRTHPHHRRSCRRHPGGHGAAVARTAEAQKYWDVANYDKCIANRPDDAQGCCLNSDGEWNGSKCVAPAANAEATTRPPIPGSIVTPGNIVTRPTNARLP